MKSGSEGTRTQAPGTGDGQESLACCSPWDGKELDMTEQLNRTELNSFFNQYFQRKEIPSDQTSLMKFKINIEIEMKG